MKLIFYHLLFLPGFACATRQKRTDPSGCHADNCLRAIRATTQLAQASVDCSSFLDVTVTPPPVTVTVTSTTTGLAKRYATPTYYSEGIPTYASACVDADEYSSACSCIGVTPTTTTVAAASSTVTSTVTATPSCVGETCATGFVPTCDTDSSSCYCFTGADGEGFCGENAPCGGLSECETDLDCLVAEDSSGDTCAVNTCCGSSGYCLIGLCSNPSSKLTRMAKAAARIHLEGNSAAFLGH